MSIINLLDKTWQVAPCCHGWCLTNHKLRYNNFVTDNAILDGDYWISINTSPDFFHAIVLMKIILII